VPAVFKRMAENDFDGLFGDDKEPPKVEEEDVLSR
jgi:hypothetical protein